MQHDLKTKEIRQPEAQLAAWCICGEWRYVSAKLHEGPVVEGFIEHLEQVQRENAARRFHEENAPF